jgi:crotonobetainyl-CoA:carnitine CoA-transferase CaiB-like acyl-CoA transferase
MIMDGSPLRVRRHAPMRSEHTAEVLAEVGYDADAIAALVAAGAAHVRTD